MIEPVRHAAWKTREAGEPPAKMSSGKGVTFRVSYETDRGERELMEDFIDVRLSPNEALRRIPGLKNHVFVGVFDGHGGKEAALYARERLWDIVQEQLKFRSTDREKVVEAIVDAYWSIHKEMQSKRNSWEPYKWGGGPSAAGTTVCTVIFRPGLFYVANVGDSSAVLAIVNERAGEKGESPLVATMLSRDHKPDDPTEVERVKQLGGQVKVKNGVPRVVWERKTPSDDPDKPPTIDFIPYLNVSRSLGDFWSWSDRTNQFVVSPHPDVGVHPFDPAHQRFLVLASDGLWNVMTPQEAVDFVWEYTAGKELKCQDDSARALINEALCRWRRKGMLADNISVVITFFSKGDTSPQESSEEAAGERESLSISCRNQGEADGEGEERVAVRRAREEVESVPPPQKGTRQEREL